MKTLLQRDHLVLISESPDELAALNAWRATYDGFVFVMLPNAGSGVSLRALGPQADACREPINVTGSSPEPIRLIANFAATPFELDGTTYACVEAFWQSLRFPLAERPRIAALDGPAAKRASEQMPYGATIEYGGETIPVGAYAHWQLMRRACMAKFQQHDAARSALLGTGTRPLVHQVRHDSRTIPGVIMADIWMRIRTILRQ
jgi:predicted NAD-dependent protein-ADP-ribosyltransferase YbiA (DUF1768 family)